MGGHRRRVTWNHQGVFLSVRRVGRGAAVLRCGEMDVVAADLVPNLLSVARRSVAVEVTEVTVDFVQVPLLREEVRERKKRGKEMKGESVNTKINEKEDRAI